MKLSYFNLRGRAEASRLMLAQAGVEYEDCRFEKDEFADHKPNMKWGTVPMLEDGDLCLGQTLAISRYIANKYGFNGKTSTEQYECDVVVDTIVDLLTPLGKFFLSSDEDEKAKSVEDFKKSAPTLIRALVKKLETNGGTYMVGDSLTRADFGVFNVLSSLWLAKEETSPAGLDEVMETMLPLKAVHDMVAALPNVQKWVETRPQTEL